MLKDIIIFILAVELAVSSIVIHKNIKAMKQLQRVAENFIKHK